MILNAYQYYTNPDETDIANIYSLIDDNYDDVQLLNDFNHLTRFHATEFEDIYNVLLSNVYDDQPCDLSLCLCLRRNRRNRADEKENIDLYRCDDVGDIISYQIIDRIHCHYFHSFDTGYKLFRKDIENIKSEIEPIEDEKEHGNSDPNLKNKYIQKLVEKAKYLKDNSKLNNIESHNKFITKENKVDDLYQFGYRFFYHKYYKNNRDFARPYDPIIPLSKLENIIEHIPANTGYCLDDLYVAPKYKNLKEELTKNRLCAVNKTAMVYLLEKATIKMQTDYVKSMSCARGESAKYYEMKSNQPLSEDHVLAAMVYCNYTALQGIFTQTYWKQSGDELLDDLKKRHSNYYWLGRRLKECVECFGMDHNNQLKYRFYHGINKKMQFKSLFAYMKGPCSTTTDFAVAARFSQGQGMILELEIDTKSWIFKILEDGLPIPVIGSQAMNKIHCFDMQCFSDYSNEKEVFCLGGINRFHITEIIEVSTAIDYKIYLKALRQMTSGMTYALSSIDTFDQYIPKTASEKQIVFRLLAHQIWKKIPDHKYAHQFKSLPKYIDNLMEAHCKQVRFIQFFNSKPRHIVQDLVFTTDETGMKSMEELMTIFPSLKEVRYIMHNDATTDVSIFEKKLDGILKFIQRSKAKNTRFEMPSLAFAVNPEIGGNLEDLVKSKYKEKFNALNYKIRVQHRDPVKSWEDNLKISIGELLENPIVKTLVDIWMNNGVLREILGCLATAAGRNKDDFDVIKDHDKLQQTFLGIGINNNVLWRRGELDVD